MRALSQMTSPLRNSFVQTIVRPVRGYQRATFGRQRLVSRSPPAYRPRMPNTPSRVSARDAHMINESRRGCQSVLIDRSDAGGTRNEETNEERVTAQKLSSPMKTALVVRLKEKRKKKKNGQKKFRTVGGVSALVSTLNNLDRSLANFSFFRKNLSNI